MKRSECANWCAEQRTDEKVGAAKKGRADAMEKSMVQRRLGRFKVTAEALAGQGSTGGNKCGDRKCVSECKGLSVTDCTKSYMWSDGAALGCIDSGPLSRLGFGATCTCEHLSHKRLSRAFHTKSEVAAAADQDLTMSRSCQYSHKMAGRARDNVRWGKR